VSVLNQTKAVFVYTAAVSSNTKTEFCRSVSGLNRSGAEFRVFSRLEKKELTKYSQLRQNFVVDRWRRRF
jgi:hypothetical protein